MRYIPTHMQRHIRDAHEVHPSGRARAIAALVLVATAGACGRTQTDPFMIAGPGAIGGSGGGTAGASGSGGGGASGGAGGAGNGVTQIVAGDNHTCALFSNGQVRCWGRNNLGQLGYGHTRTIGDDELPSSAGVVSVTTTPGVIVTQLAAAVDRTCALLSDGSVKCWGDNGFGQLGYGNRTIIGDDELPSSVGPISLSPTPGMGAAAIVAGGNHTCARLASGPLVCWGLSSNGELGYGNTTTIGDDELPSAAGAVDLTRMNGVSITGLGAGRFETCALLSDKTLKCWGLNSFGELGYGNILTIGDNEPPSSVGAVSVSASPGLYPVSIVAGDFHTCALLSNSGVRCWGSNLDGELGYGNTQRIGDNELPSAAPGVPVSATPGATVLSLAAGYGHTCAILSNGTLQCWGANMYGQLGLGNVNNVGDDEFPSSVGPVSVTSMPGVTVTAVTAGSGHTCALLSDGEVKCWGDNRYGQLGYGNTQRIGDDEVPSSVGAVSID